MYITQLNVDSNTLKVLPGYIVQKSGSQIIAYTCTCMYVLVQWNLDYRTSLTLGACVRVTVVVLCVCVYLTNRATRFIHGWKMIH